MAEVQPLSAGAVSRRLGIAVTTLRTWHQRYGLGPSEHVPGHHRRYTAEDLARLEVMRRLTIEGVPPAVAARWARQSAAGPGRPGAATRPGPAGRDGGGRDGGGRAIPVGRAGPAVRGLARAALRLDAAAMRELIDRSVAGFGVVPTWDQLLRPVLTGIGDRHFATGRLIEVEHLLARSISEVLGAVPRPAPNGQPPLILLACVDEEQHTLPLEALAAALAEIGVSCRQFGARVPPEALARAVGRTGPAIVVLWSHTTETADPGQLRALFAHPRRPVVVAAAGPGWDEGEVPAETVILHSLTEAVRMTTAAAESANHPSRG